MSWTCPLFSISTAAIRGQATVTSQCMAEGRVSLNGLSMVIANNFLSIFVCQLERFLKENKQTNITSLPKSLQLLVLEIESKHKALPVCLPIQTCALFTVLRTHRLLSAPSRITREFCVSFHRGLCITCIKWFPMEENFHKCLKFIYEIPYAKLLSSKNYFKTKFSLSI